MLSAHIKFLLAGYLTKDRSVPFHRLFHERWDRQFWSEYRRASLFDRMIDKHSLRRVWVLSYSCSGTHNFCSRFHYMPGVFVFGENLFSDKVSDPFQFRFQIGQVRPAHWLFGSIFLQHGLQAKDGRAVTHLFLLSNHLLRYKDEIDINAVTDQDHIVVYLRNFIRVLFSQDKDSRKYHKPHFAMTDAHFASAVVSHRRRIDEILHLTENHESKLTICFHERFCAVPHHVIHQLGDRIGLASSARNGWNQPEDFFVRCYRNGMPPEFSDGELKCPMTKMPIYGKGGFYNPLPPVDLQRTIAAPIKEWLTKERQALLTRTFGNELVDFWLNDNVHDYAEMNDGELIGMLLRSRQ
jgi:hypothetical protein